MVQEHATISSIQTFFDSLFRGRLDDNIFFDAPPQVIGDSWKSFVVVDLGTEIRDMDAFSDGTVRVMIYVRPLVSGSVNASLTQQKEHVLNSIIHALSDEHYVLRRLGSFSDYDTDTGFHLVAYILKIKIY